MTRTRFTKGHGTRNDFVLLADTRGEIDLTADHVRALADRRGGIGGDGVIRLAPTASVAESRAVLAEDPTAIWFMDYRNADGSVAEMCGNGVRVFAAFAERLGLISFADGAAVAVGTRAGVKRVRKEAGGWYAVDMGPWHLTGGEEALAAGYDATVVVAGWPVPRPALGVNVGNPHTVLAIAGTDLLAAADLTRAPEVDPVPPAGTNVELVVPLGEERDADGTVIGRTRMRVYERGVGETPSCGTGACAAALAVRAWAGPTAPDTWLVQVPGGDLRVRVDGERVELAGPAELVFSGEIELTEDGFVAVRHAAALPGHPVVGHGETPHDGGSSPDGGSPGSDDADHGARSVAGPEPHEARAKEPDDGERADGGAAPGAGAGSGPADGQDDAVTSSTR